MLCSTTASKVCAAFGGLHGGRRRPNQPGKESLGPDFINLITHSFVSAVCKADKGLEPDFTDLVTHLFISAVCMMNKNRCLLYQHYG